MQLLSVVVAVALCGTLASALSLRNPATSAATESDKSEALKKVSTTGIKRGSDGNDARFGGEKPTGGKLSYTFPQDFDLLNPNNSNSDWQWVATSGNNETVLNDGTLLEHEDTDAVNLVSLPYRAWAPTDEKRLTPVVVQYKALLANKQNITVLAGQKLSVNVKFTCKTFNNEKVPLTSTNESISKPEDDPSLAACAVGILSHDESALGVSVIATNKGVWVLYERNRIEMSLHPERNHREFDIYKRVADRTSSNETVDATIVYDRTEGKVHIHVNGQEVHSIGDLGTINEAVAADPAYNDVYTKDREDLKKSEPQDIQVIISLGQQTDTIDPNNPSNPPVRSTRLTTDPNYYDPKAKFEDDVNIKGNVIWGEGAAMSIMKVDIELTGKE